MERSFMKQLIIFISLLASVAFLGLSVVATWQIFSTLIAADGVPLRGELWAFLILTFTAGVIMIMLAWGIAEIGNRPASRPQAPPSTEE
jgi:hypothetical protein